MFNISIYQLYRYTQNTCIYMQMHNMYIHICMYILCIYIHTSLSIYTHIYQDIYIYICTYVYLYIYICYSVRTHMLVSYITIMSANSSWIFLHTVIYIYCLFFVMSCCHTGKYVSGEMFLVVRLGDAPFQPLHLCIRISLYVQIICI